MRDKVISVALAGNPNCGKTTIFNNITGAHQRVGNYPGVTVEKKEGSATFKGRRINVVDLPGTYSLTAYSLEELVARNYIISARPDVVIDVVDTSNLERNLYLAVELIELSAPLVLAFNMSDVAKQRGMNINLELLSQLLGTPIVLTVGHKRKGHEKLMETAIAVAEGATIYPP
nr:GTP-binding protein [Bacillota bacterium]